MSVSSYDLYRFEINRVAILLEFAESPAESDILGVALAHLKSDFHYKCESGMLVDSVGQKSAKMAVSVKVADSQK